MILLFLLLVLLIPTQMGKHWWPRWSLVEGVRVDYLSPTLYLTDLLVLGVIVGLIVKNRKSQIINHGWRKSKVFRFFLIFHFLLIICWISQSDRPWLAGYWLARYWQIPIVAWLVIKVREIRKLDLEIRNLLAVGAVFSVGLGLAQILLSRTTGWFWLLGERSFTVASPGVATISIQGREVLRPYATFSHPNAFAGWLAVVGMWMAIRAKKSGEIIDKWVTRLSFGGVFLTASRTAILALVAGWLVPSGFAGVMTPVQFSKSSILQRVHLIKAAGRMFLDHPWLGVGPGQFLVKLPEYLSGGEGVIQPVHNVLLLLLAEFGIAGTAGGLIGVIWLTRAIRGRDKTWNFWLPVLTVFLITGMADHYWLTAQQNRLLSGLTLGLILTNSKSRIRN